MIPAHTPGPWSADDGDDQYYGVFGPDGEEICYPIMPLPQNPNESQTWEALKQHIANALLIAAAPDLLKALQHARLFILENFEGDAEEILSESWNAITKALPDPSRDMPDSEDVKELQRRTDLDERTAKALLRRQAE